MIYKKTTQDGFTLVETLVSITILLLVIIGPMTISSSAARSTSFSSEQVIAFFLAQEGAELAQKARDDLWLGDFTNPGTGWSDFTNISAGTYADCFTNDGCRLEIETDAVGSIKLPVADCNPVSDCRLYFDPNNDRSRYNHDSSSPITTPYTRIIKFEEITSDEVKVTSRVYWRSGNQRQNQEAVVETYLFNVYGS